MSLVFHSSKLTVSAEQFRSNFCLHCSMPSEQWMTESEIRERRRRNSKRDTPTVWFQECLIRCMITEPNRYIGQCRTSYNHVTYNSNFLCITSMRSTPGPWKYIVRYGTWHNIWVCNRGSAVPTYFPANKTEIWQGIRPWLPAPLSPTIVLEDMPCCFLNHSSHPLLHVNASSFNSEASVLALATNAWPLTARLAALAFSKYSTSGFSFSALWVTDVLSLAQETFLEPIRRWDVQFLGDLRFSPATLLHL